MSEDRRPNPELWSCYMQYLAADGVTPVTEVVLYEAEWELDRKLYVGLNPLDGLLMARTHLLATLARLSAAAIADLPGDKDVGGDVQQALPVPPND